MASRLPPLFFRLALLVALGVSSALLIDYFRPLPAFCDIGSGCDRIRASCYGRVLGVPVALIGLLGFAVVMSVSLVQGERARRVARILAVAAGVTGVLLLIAQGLVLKVFCRLCVVVDISAMVAAVSALSMDPPEAAAPIDRIGARRWLWPAASIASILLPAIWAVLQPSPPVPPEIASLWAPGKLNVVEFVDFQCPFCRQQHPRLVEVLEDYRGRVHFVRLNMPLASHSQARHAARAYCCAEDQGKGPEMADALFAAESLTPEACEKLAASLGLVMPSYRTCVVSPSTDARIDEQIRIVRSAGLAGLPTLWIGDKLLIGLQPIDTLRQAFVDATRSGTSRRLPTAVLWAAFAATLAVVGALAIRLPRRRAEGRTG